jgi:acyl-CoA synthetase (AMP-forming)/AMP-acid ligase II
MNIDLERARQLVLGEILSRWAKIIPEGECIAFENRRLSYREFNDRVNRLANALTNQGIRHGDHVGVLMTNCIPVAEIAYALAKLGAVYVPSNFRYSVGEHVYQFDLAQIKALVFAPEFSEVVAEVIKDVPSLATLICLDETPLPNVLMYETLVAGASPEPPLVYVDDDDVCAIIYTSGTTGKPKGVVLTHKNILTTAFTFGVYAPKIDLPEGTNLLKVLMLLPTFHISGYGSIIYAITGGGTLLLSNRTGPEEIMASIQQEKINQITLVPALWNWIVSHPNFDKYDLSSLLLGGTGGAIMPREVKARVVERLPQMKLIEAFGMAETVSLGTFATHEDMMAKDGTVGRRQFTIDVRVVDDNDNDVPVGRTGEIVYRGPSVFKEYYRDPKTTAEAFSGGWFHSGDLVREDEDGYFYVVGRKKDIIISGGENIASAEIEEVLHTHPKIRDAAVIGVPDEKWGEAVKAYVVLHSGESLTESEVIDFCKEKLASYKKPRNVSFVSHFPMTEGGKVQKFELKKWHADGI